MSLMHMPSDATEGWGGWGVNIVLWRKMQVIQMVQPAIIDFFAIWPLMLLWLESLDWSIIIFAKLVAFMLTLQHMAVAQCPISHLSRHRCSFRQGNETQCALKFKWRRLHFCEEWLTTVSAVQLMSRVFLLSIQSQVAVTERPFSFVYPGSLEESDNNKLWRMDGEGNH